MICTSDLKALPISSVSVLTSCEVTDVFLDSLIIGTSDHGQANTLGPLQNESIERSNTNNNRSAWSTLYTHHKGPLRAKAIQHDADILGHVEDTKLSVLLVPMPVLSLYGRRSGGLSGKSSSKVVARDVLSWLTCGLVVTLSSCENDAETGALRRQQTRAVTFVDTVACVFPCCLFVGVFVRRFAAWLGR